MKAIAVVFIPARNGHALSEPALGIRPNEPLQQLAVLNGRNKSDGQLQRDQSPPPFWTWFIENPRRRNA